MSKVMGWRFDVVEDGFEWRTEATKTTSDRRDPFYHTIIRTWFLRKPDAEVFSALLKRGVLMFELGLQRVDVEAFVNVLRDWAEMTPAERQSCGLEQQRDALIDAFDLALSRVEGKEKGK